LMIRSVAEALQQRFKTFQFIDQSQCFDCICNDQRQLVSVIPWQDPYGLDWLVVVSVPETDLIA
jgi:hypothetical protein